ncbi:MAG: flagellar hook-basal body complex protein [Clostridium sp.]|uniref:flagellar hook-basal body complex protein n=1 Tax=Clostridium sp. TaxID=1506 RepID=UPI0025C3FABA|nr:flagellar hook-basal body complex protein [Clostridium sp.]MCH3964218.1 flagellar hook-basal body complex protein [Clostridium sp.]MCI1715399.1 flagellar hook-basal body complex protein [Clostridium sp.]MCI1799810.1 flagellar hook-basal body complex protein [Clostridium sp.]MCI1813582.1 flagellar hook-basal body complex protein [Clostridium sp.]MCI1870628.1 flagellar hook-basal body complex protein [Clostridium sp.]
MLPSLYSGISGLRANQQKLNVIGNNIANSTTTGFKSQSMNFQDMISQTLSDPSAPSNSIGGINGKQSGLGVKVAGISTDFTTGSMQTTNRTLDFAIDGPGYFVVGTGAVAGQTSDGIGGVAVNEETNALGGGEDVEYPIDPTYTRDGAFFLDTQGNLLTVDGKRVMGYQIGDAAISYTDDPNAQNTVAFQDANADGIEADTTHLVPLSIPDAIGEEGAESKVKTFSVSKDGYITAQLADGTTAALGQIAMVSFVNEGGLIKNGGNTYSVSANSGQPIVRSARGVDAEVDNSGSYGSMAQGMLEMSNVDLAQQFTDMIVASRAFQANGKIITTDDEILQDLINLKR